MIAPSIRSPHRWSCPFVLAALLLLPGAVRAAAPPGLALGADLSFLPQVEAAGAVFRDDSGPAEATALLRRHGFDWVRLRLWNRPRDGHGGLAEVLETARRARDRGMALLLDLHYSDTWADPGHQQPPAAWAGLPRTALEDSVRAFTRDAVAALLAQGTPPAMVQLGNEISHGLLWDAGRIVDDRPASWRNAAALLRAGARGVAEGAPGRRVPILIHHDAGGDSAACRRFFARLLAAGAPCDVIGVSFYPWWHGTLDRLAANLHGLATTFGRDVVVVETAYPWTLAALDDTHDLVGLPTQLHAGFPATPAGQAAFLARLAAVVRDVPGGHGRGVFVWAPDWVSAPRLGSAGENLALFDDRGRLLPAADSLAAIARGRPTP